MTSEFGLMLDVD
jgi:hypothetical protein